MGRGLEEMSAQRNHTNGQEGCEKVLTVTNEGNASKTTMRYNLICVRMALMKKTRDNGCW